MRTITAAQAAVRATGSQGDHVRVSVKDSGGTFRDLTTYPGFNAVQSVRWAESVDSPHMTADIVLKREAFKLSLAPLVAASALNRGFNPSASYSPLLALTREVKVEVAITAVDRAPVSGDWFEVFRGRIDEIDAASGEDVRLACRDLGGRLAQQFIKVEHVLSFASVGGVSVPLRIWEPQQVVAVGDYCLPASRGDGDPGEDKFFVCSVGGTTGAEEPVWTTGTAISEDSGPVEWDYVGAPSTSGNPVEQVIQNILTRYKSAADPSVTLYTPTSPGWAIRQFLQKREFTLNACRALANQIGWDVRFKWRSATNQFEFTLFEPQRSAPSVAYTFTASDYETPTRLSVNIANIRNAWRVLYSDRSDLFPDGTPKRKVIEVSDSASITKYGELWAEIQEDSSSQIDSSTEATKLANAALSDCKEPTAELSVPLAQGFPWVELGDFYTFGANGLHFDADQSLAVTSWAQSFEAGKLKTTLEVRGLPTIGASTHLARTEHPARFELREPHRVVHFPGPNTRTAVLKAEIGGVSARLVETLDKAQLFEADTELHLSTLAGFTPDASTLNTNIRGGAKSLGDLVPGKTYYAKTVPRYFNAGRVVRGQPSAEQSFVAGRAKAGHYDSASTQSHLPLNGNFEHATDDLATAPPDHWQVVTRPTESTEEWGSAGSVYYGEDFTTKGRYLELRAHASKRGNIMCSPFEVRRGSRALNLYLSIMRTGSSAVSGKDLIVDVLGYADAALANQIINYSFFLSGDSAGPFPSLSTWYDHAIDLAATTGALGATVNFIRLGLRRGTTGDASFAWRVGDVFFQEADFKQLLADSATITNLTPTTITVEAFTGLTFATGWANYGGGWRAGQYMKDRSSFVHLRGLVQRTSGASATIATLPTGYRPTATEGPFAVDSNGAHAWVEIQTDGDIVLTGGSPASWVSLANIKFRAD